MRQICPCKDCTYRIFLCHSMCEKYKAWKMTLEAESIERQKENDKHTNPKRPQKYKRKLRMK